MSSDQQEEKYRIPIEEAIRRVCILHPHARLQENNKVLNWLVVKEYSATFRKYIYDNPEAMGDLLENVPDFDSITRARQKVQNQCHRCNHSKKYHEGEKGKCGKCKCPEFEGWFTDKDIRKVIPAGEQDLKQKTPGDLTKFLAQ